MKELIFIAIVINLFLSCNGHKSIVANTSLCEFDDTIAKEEMFFDKRKYLKEKDTIKDDEVYIRRYYTHPTHKTIVVVQTNKQTNIDKNIVYSKEGKIIGVWFNYRDESIGREIDYNEQGNITKVVDHDKGYKICWAQAIEIVKQKFENRVSKYDSINYVLERVDLNEFPDERPIWSVGVAPEPDDKPGETTYYKIDGVTGKYLGKLTLRMGKHK